MEDDRPAADFFIGILRKGSKGVRALLKEFGFSRVETCRCARCHENVAEVGASHSSTSWLYITRFSKYTSQEEVMNMKSNVDLMKILDTVAAQLAKLFLQNEPNSSSLAKFHWSEKTCDETGIRNTCSEHGSMVSFAYKSQLYLYVLATLSKGKVFPGAATLISKEAKYALSVAEKDAALRAWEAVTESPLRKQVHDELVGKKSRLSRKLRNVLGRSLD